MEIPTTNLFEEDFISTAYDALSFSTTDPVNDGNDVAIVYDKHEKLFKLLPLLTYTKELYEGPAKRYIWVASVYPEVFSEVVQDQCT